MSNPLLNFFETNKGNAMNKWMHYFDVYHRHFSRYVGEEVVILEIGVFQGGSLRMWKHYFGDKAKIYAIDVFEQCKQFEENQIEILIGSQSDRAFLREVKAKIPKVDILIDDGGHFMDQQIISFEELYPHIKSDGIYLCEDLHTSYWKRYNGGYRNPLSFIEYSKSFIDFINAWHSEDEQLQINDITRSAYSLHYYDSILVIEKKIIASPRAEIRGELVIKLEDFPENQPKVIIEKVDSKKGFQLFKWLKSISNR